MGLLNLLSLLLVVTIEEAFRRSESEEVLRCLRAVWRRPRSASFATATMLDVEDDDRSATKPTAWAARDDATARRLADDDGISLKNLQTISND